MKDVTTRFVHDSNLQQSLCIQPKINQDISDTSVHRRISVMLGKRGGIFRFFYAQDVSRTTFIFMVNT